MFPIHQYSNKTAKLICILLVLCLIMCGCETKLTYRDIDDIEQLDGHRIGVCLAWAADYLLTGRDDMNLLRYNDHGSLVTALYYRRLDAIAVERTIANHIMNCVTGLRILEPAISSHSYVIYVHPSQEEVLENFNAFIAEFRNTEEYADIVRRVNAPGEYDYHPVTLTGGDKTLSVAVTDSEYPFSYMDFTTKEAIGSDIELISHFANAYGYSLEFTASDYETMEMRVLYGQADLAISALSTLWSEDILKLGGILISDTYMDGDVVFVEVEDPDALEIVSTLEY